MTVAVGLSGGVDSCVAAYLLKKAGYDVVGVTMSLAHVPALPVGLPGRACFGPHEKESLEAAQTFAQQLGIPYYVFDCGARYATEILDYFRRTYLEGRTPNPCVKCNAVMKFGLLPRLAQEQGVAFDKFATGHYARLGAQDGRITLKRARDTHKDQSYFLCLLSQAQLARQLFPLGDVTKNEVRTLAAELGFAAANRPDSQDFYDGNRDDLLSAEERLGDIVTVDGKRLGTHRGFWHYTVGQRKGLGVGGGTPYYVIRLDAQENRVIVGTRADAFGTTFAVDDLNWVSISPTTSPLPCRVKIRSTGEPLGPARLENGICHVPGGLFGITPGQYAVFYDEMGETVLAGGIIRLFRPAHLQANALGTPR